MLSEKHRGGVPFKNPYPQIPPNPFPRRQPERDVDPRPPSELRKLGMMPRPDRQTDIERVKSHPYWGAFVRAMGEHKVAEPDRWTVESALTCIEALEQRGVTWNEVEATTRWKVSAPRIKPYEFNYLCTDVFKWRQVKPPVAETAVEQDGSRYISGKYADIIDH